MREADLSEWVYERLGPEHLAVKQLQEVEDYLFVRSLKGDEGATTLLREVFNRKGETR